MEYRNYKNNIYNRKRQYSGTFPHHPEMSAFGVDALLGPFLVPKKGGATDSDLKKKCLLCLGIVQFHVIFVSITTIIIILRNQFITFITQIS